MFYNRFLGAFVSINLFVLKIVMCQQTFFTSKCFDVEIIEKYHVVKGCLKYMYDVGCFIKPNDPRFENVL